MVIPGRPNGSPYSEAAMNKTTTLLGSCLVEMANKVRTHHPYTETLTCNQGLGKLRSLFHRIKDLLPHIFFKRVVLHI